MKLMTIVLFMMFGPGLTWSGDFEAARTDAAGSHKYLLVNFSGSDWCGPCIRLRNTILEAKDFEAYAADHLVLVRADFPRQKKNQLPKDQVKRNEALADKYNPDGKFPYTLLLDSNGKVIKTWEGCPDETPAQFVGEIEQQLHASH